MTSFCDITRRHFVSVGQAVWLWGRWRTDRRKHRTDSITSTAAAGGKKSVEDLLNRFEARFHILRYCMQLFRIVPNQEAFFFFCYSFLLKHLPVLVFKVCNWKCENTIQEIVKWIRINCTQITKKSFLDITFQQLTLQTRWCKKKKKSPKSCKTFCLRAIAPNTSDAGNSMYCKSTKFSVLFNFANFAFLSNSQN